MSSMLHVSINSKTTKVVINSCELVETVHQQSISDHFEQSVEKQPEDYMVVII